MKNNHWNKYYNLHDKPFEKSDFAVFSLDYIEKGQRLIDIGCGNGRDSVFFKEHGLTTLGIDYSSVAIQNLSKYESKNLKFKQLDVSKITKVLKMNILMFATVDFLFIVLKKKMKKFYSTGLTQMLKNYY